MTIEESIKEVAGDNAEWLLKKVQWYIHSSKFQDEYKNANNFRFADMSNQKQLSELEFNATNKWFSSAAAWTFRHPSGKCYRNVDGPRRGRDLAGRTSEVRADPRA